MGLISGEEIAGLFGDLGAYNGTFTVKQALGSPPVWQDVPGWVTIDAAIVTDPDRDDVDYLIRVPATNVPEAGLNLVSAAMQVWIDSPMKPAGPYGIRLIDDVGGAGLVYEIAVHRVRSRS